MSTPDQKVADAIGRNIDGRIAALQNERGILLNAAARIAAIDAEILVLQAEKARIDPRRPQRLEPMGARSLSESPT